MAHEKNLIDENAESINVAVIFMLIGLALAKLVFDKLKSGRGNLRIDFESLVLAELCMAAALANISLTAGAWYLATGRRIESTRIGMGLMATAGCLPATMAAGFIIDTDTAKPDSVLFATQVGAAAALGSVVTGNLLAATAAATFPTALTFSYMQNRNKPTLQMFRDATITAGVATGAVWACTNTLS